LMVHEFKKKFLESTADYRQEGKVVARTSKIVVDSKGFCLISSKSSVNGACYFMELLLLVRVFSTARLKMKTLLLALVSAARVVLS
ncbi:hypothetical protein Tco_0855472, partial [Tanacetum coccineum]